MSDPLPPSYTRVYLNAPPFLRAVGCTGCSLGCLVLVVAVFVVGGIIGVLLFGWKTLMGY